MNFVTHNTEDLEITGTHLQGEINASYTELVDLFGEPTEGDGYKTDAEWIVKWDDGTLATVYNWKDGPNYCGEHGTPVKSIKGWHVGGASRSALDRVQIAIDLHREGATKKKGPVEEMIDCRNDMLDMLKAQKGEPFAKAVWFASLVHKQIDLFQVLVHANEAGARAPKQVSDQLGHITATVFAQMLDAYCESVGACRTREEAQEMMKWCDRLSEAEQAGVAPIVAELQKRGGKR